MGNAMGNAVGGPAHGVGAPAAPDAGEFGAMERLFNPALQDEADRMAMADVMTAARLCMLLEPCLLDLNEMASHPPLERALKLGGVLVQQAQVNEGIRINLRDNGVMDKLKAIALQRKQFMDNGGVVEGLALRDDLASLSDKVGERTRHV